MGGATLRVIHTPGHASDHVALLLEEEPAMFTGDNVLGTGTPVFIDLPLYIRSLRSMKEACPDGAALYTSHGPKVLDGPALIDEYIAHRTARVEQIRATLAGQDGWHTAEQITRAIYTKHPEHLIGPATGNTLQALRVLEEQHDVECDVSASGRGRNARWRISQG